jgi:hypothetical protein
MSMDPLDITQLIKIVTFVLGFLIIFRILEALRKLVK